MAQAREYNYSVYALFDEATADVIKQISATLQTEFKDSLVYEVTEDPHVTILYGPAITDPKQEVTTVDKAHLVLPGFKAKFNKQLPSLLYKGVSCFERDGKVIVKLEFSSDALTNMQMYLRNSLPDVKKRYAQYAAEIKDGSYDEPPRRWAHATLAVVKPEAKDKVMDAAQKLAYSFPVFVHVKSIALVSAVQDKIVPLW